MKEEAEINFDDLRQRIEGDLLDSDLDRSLYSSGPSIFRVKPRAIVRPKNKDDVVKTIQFARQHRVPITAKGGGSSRVGNDLGAGIVIDFCKYMNRVLEFDPANKWVRVEPGIILADLNNQVKASKLYFPIDPSTKDWCSLGGMIANNSSGPHAVKYGTTRKHVSLTESSRSWAAMKKPWRKKNLSPQKTPAATICGISSMRTTWISPPCSPVRREPSAL
jgi:FAD/FMN-containing dehydrogenase